MIGPIPRGTDLWQEKYNARTSVERAYPEEKGSHRLVNPRVREVAKVKTHVYLALCAQVIKRFGAMIMMRLTKPHPIPCPVRAWRTLKEIAGSCLLRRYCLSGGIIPLAS